MMMKSERPSHPPLKLTPLLVAVVLMLFTFGWQRGARQIEAHDAPTTPQSPSQAQSTQQPQPQELVTSYPPGAVAVFTNVIAPSRDDKKPLVYLKRADGDGREWMVAADYVVGGAAASSAANSAAEPQLVAFVVPQLAGGTYSARYEIPGSVVAREPMKLVIRPQIILKEGMVKGQPGSVVEVRAGISPALVLEGDQRTPTSTSVEITLSSSDPATADLLPNQSATEATGEDGFATWKVRINRSGSAQLVAAARGFESAEINVEGVMPPSRELEAATRELKQARSEAAEREAASSLADADAERLKLETLAVAQEAERAAAREQVEDIANRTPAANANANRRRAEKEKKSLPSNEERRGQTASAEQLLKERDRLQQHTAEATVKADAADRREAQALMRVSRDELTLSTHTPSQADAVPQLNFDDLLPGDVLLVQSQGFISDAIRFFEQSQLGNEGRYSHAILYVGKMRIDGQDVPMVAEMLSSGYWIRPLSLSVREVRFADVYRWKGLTDAQRNQVALRGKSMFRGAPEDFIRMTDPGLRDAWFAVRRGTFYAYPQIELLTAAASHASPSELIANALAVDLLNGGKKRMICSELVAWAYKDAGLDPQIVHWWPVLDAAHLFDFHGDDRRKDYTTPNDLAGKDSKLTWEGRLNRP